MPDQRLNARRNDRASEAHLVGDRLQQVVTPNRGHTDSLLQLPGVERVSLHGIRDEQIQVILYVPAE